MEFIFAGILIVRLNNIFLYFPRVSRALGHAAAGLENGNDFTCDIHTFYSDFTIAKLQFYSVTSLPFVEIIIGQRAFLSYFPLAAAHRGHSPLTTYSVSSGSKPFGRATCGMLTLVRQ